MKKIVIVIGAALCLAAWNIEASPNVYAWGGASTVPGDLTNAVQVSVGWGHFLALRDDGTITGWGTNDVGQAVDPFGLTTTVQVSAGPSVSAATLADGTIAVWGQVDPAVVFPDDLTNVVKIVACETNEFFVLRDTGEADAFGDYTNIILYGVVDIAGVKYSAGLGDSCLIASFTDGSVWVSDTKATPASGNHIPVCATNAIQVAASSGNTRAILRGDGVAVWWNIVSGVNGILLPMNGTNIVDMAGALNINMYMLSTNGSVRTVAGSTKWPTNSPALQSISAGYNSGAGIIQP